MSTEVIPCLSVCGKLVVKSLHIDTKYVIHYCKKGVYMFNHGGFLKDWSDLLMRVLL